LNAPLAYAREHTLDLSTSPSWWDAESECTLVLAQPRTEPELWDEYLAGAVRSYQKYGVQDAIELDQLASGGDTLLFFAAIDAKGRVLAGLRAKGPLTSADDSHAVVEWAGQPGLPAVRKMIDDRVPFGVLEMKTAWVTDDRERNRSLTRVLARTASHAMALTDIQFCMATAGAHVLGRWRSSGGVVAEHITPTPYPDERYETRMMWWDRRTFTKFAEPEQVSKMLAESRALVRMTSADAGADSFYRGRGRDARPASIGALAELA
jgi:hypothetical protein